MRPPPRRCRRSTCQASRRRKSGSRSASKAREADQRDALRHLIELGDREGQGVGPERVAEEAIGTLAGRLHVRQHGADIVGHLLLCRLFRPEIAERVDADDLDPLGRQPVADRLVEVAPAAVAGEEDDDALGLSLRLAHHDRQFGPVRIGDRESPLHDRARPRVGRGDRIWPARIGAVIAVAISVPSEATKVNARQVGASVVGKGAGTGGGSPWRLADGWGCGVGDGRRIQREPPASVRAGASATAA